ncbi:hypothetical protein [Lysinibacillus sp. UGB7]|uniref:hypothetical protein n=1 Tax=Lysinibacillus TaxID=400634 RepID=UPI003B7E7716
MAKYAETLFNELCMINKSFTQNDLRLANGLKPIKIGNVHLEKKVICLCLEGSE